MIPFLVFQSARCQLLTVVVAVVVVEVVVVVVVVVAVVVVVVDEGEISVTCLQCCDSTERKYSGSYRPGPICQLILAFIPW